MAQLTDLDQVRKRRARRRTIKGFVTLGIFALVVFGCAFLIELMDLHGRDKIQGVEIKTLMEY